jgi:hypothetical protein
MMVETVIQKNFQGGGGFFIKKYFDQRKRAGNTKYQMFQVLYCIKIKVGGTFAAPPSSFLSIFSVPCLWFQVAVASASASTTQ